MKQHKRSTSKKQESRDTKEISVAKIGLISAIVVAVIGLVGSGISSYFSSQAAQAPLLIPKRATQTAEARISLQTAQYNSTPVPVFPTGSPPQDPSAVPGFPTNTAQLAPCSAVAEFGVWLHCGIGTPGEIRTITFEAEQGGSIYIRLINKDEGELFSPRTAIYDPSGTKLSEDHSNGGAERVVRLPSSGTYTIRIEDGERAHTGEFALYTQSLQSLTSVSNYYTWSTASWLVNDSLSRRCLPV